MAEKKAVVKITADTKGFKKGLKETQKGLKGVQKETKLSSEAFSKLGATFTGIFGAQLITKTVSGLASINKELFQVGVQAQGIKKFFDQISGSSLDALREATRGTISDLQLMKSAVKGVKLGIDIQKMPALLNFARQSAKDMGEDVEVLAEKISMAIGRKSLLIMDDFGITANQLKKELNGLSVEAASVDQITEAVLRIAKATTDAGAGANDASDAYNILLATIENVKLEGGEMLINNKELKTTIESLTNTITTNAPAILQFITEWGVGAVKIAESMAKVAGFVADAFTTKQISEQVTLTEKLAKLQREGAQLAEVREKKQKRGVFSETLKQQIAENKTLQDETYKRILYLAKVKSLADEQQKKRDEAEKKRALELNNIKAGGAGGAIGASSGLKIKPLTEFDSLKASFDGSLGGAIPSNVSGMFSPDAMKLSLEENQTLYKELIETTGSKETEYLNFAKDMDLKLAEIKKKNIDDDARMAKENRDRLLSVSTNAINSINSIIGVMGNESLNAFGKFTGAIGAGSGLLDMFMPGVGSLVGAGASLLGGLFGKKEEESASSSIASVSSSELASATTRPSATITRTGAENYYDYSKVIIEGNVVGDEQVFSDFVAKITGYQAKAAGGGL